jgi:hypothetical protein
MWAEVSSSAPHFPQSGLSFNPVRWRCLKRVLCPVSFGHDNELWFHVGTKWFAQLAYCSCSFLRSNNVGCLESFCLWLRVNTTYLGVSTVKPTWCTFCSIYSELMASTCFEHYLLILRKCYTSNTCYIACALCQLAATSYAIAPLESW